MMQAASDIFLGWTRAIAGVDIYIHICVNFATSRNFNPWTPRSSCAEHIVPVGLIAPDNVVTLTSARPIDMLVSEMAVIVFPEGKATPLETGPDVTVEQVVAATEAKLALPAHIPLMQVWI
jgi:hypothetical protein